MMTGSKTKNTWHSYSNLEFLKVLKIKRMVIEVMFERKKVRLYLRWQDNAGLGVLVDKEFH